MRFLDSIQQLPREALVAIGVVIALLLLGLWVYYTRRHYVVIRRSDATQTIASELGRIADALERLAILAAPRESQPPVESQPPRRENWLSMFGR